MNKTIFTMLVISAMSMGVLIGCKGKEPEESSPPQQETPPYEITIETRPWLIYLKPADPNQINTSRKLMEVLSAISPEDMRWHCSVTTQNRQLIGRVWAHDKTDRDKMMRIIEETDHFVVLESRATYTIAFKATGGESVSSKTLLDTLHEHHPEGVTTRRYCSRKENGSLIGYISTDTKSEKDKLVSTLHSNPDLELVEVIGPEHD